MNALFTIPKPVVVLALTMAISMFVDGCASTPAPIIEKMAVANAAVQHANTADTSKNAGGELGVATTKLASAQRAMTAENYDLAGRLADETVVDAQVAELHAQSVRSRTAAVETQDAARALREEINRASPTADKAFR